MAWGGTRGGMALLGFEEEEAERKFNISFDDMTFSSPSQAHVKHMEVVMHFLMIKACPGEAQPAFKLLWPIVDKAQGREFRKWVSDKLASMQKERLIPSTPIVRSTIIENPGGTKFIAILNYLTQYVMRKQLKTMGIEVILLQFNKDHAQVCVDVLNLRVEKERARFLQHANRCAAENARLEAFAGKVAETIKTLASDREDVRAKYEKLKAEENLGDIESLRREVEAEASAVRDLWSELEAGDVQAESNRRNVKNMVVKDDDELVVDLHSMSESSGHDMKFLGENPSVESLLQRWAATMSQLHKYLIRVPSPDNGLHNLAALAESSQSLSADCDKRLESVRSLKEQLREQIHLVEKSIGSLQAEIYPTLQFPGFLDSDEDLPDEAEEEDCAVSERIEISQSSSQASSAGATEAQQPAVTADTPVEENPIELSAQTPHEVKKKLSLDGERKEAISVNHHLSPSRTPGSGGNASQRKDILLQAPHSATGKENFSPVAKPSRIPSLLAKHASTGSSSEDSGGGGKTWKPDVDGDSAIERRRAVLRQKLQGTLNDDFLKP
ncbi:hypothetical protein GUITHDRAFT_119184 [Guillardia theta CCMP2712]|uniref:HAUS augmin-like complex subunit 6 N-terminal domain-containing protein n=1 Tax=Guillardia theta (strain CCMP2712) TaxID=905079 RepID=L1IFE4_GUITC|nr:hypothetical protein GUITHDRAFT_119184 [Guillardia theta CCMP2712]EKX34639.1 hypothetical protein GUITHDRAFT_119184 [Guillardia theta CCMP2712]|eukprot:XP_005821619.1 hypothetical protein GUITHDRAFT_119184 [Guillardia theta CCMP2712]